MRKFRVLGDKIGRFPAISISKMSDITLSGRRGEIWVEGVGAYKCFVALSGGSEKIYSFRHKDLSGWVKRLEIPEDPKEQLIWANNPNLRHDLKKEEK